MSFISGKCQNVISNEKKSLRMGKNIDQMAKIASSEVESTRNTKALHIKFIKIHKDLGSFMDSK